MFTLIFYSQENSSIGDYRTFWVLILLTEILRSVLARVVLLSTALGQHITTNNIASEQYVPIVIVNLMYGASLLAATVVNDLQKYHDISDQVVFAAELPNQIINLIIAVWIIFAFRRTMGILVQESDQQRKKRIVLQLFVFFLICLSAYTIIFFCDHFA